MNQLTLRGFDEALQARIRELAAREGVSLNQAALRLLRKGAGLDRPGPRPDAIGDRLNRFVGTWGPEEAQQMAEAEATFEDIDPEPWR